ncbi:hypothetical protein BDZ45DRAFT_737110 [Acephala macrosclerotiorum]|nr:hypothetical protein BDZ45DRAFT_737110 [Acephala macrosclerotiorum]
MEITRPAALLIATMPSIGHGQIENAVSYAVEGNGLEVEFPGVGIDPTMAHRVLLDEYTSEKLDLGGLNFGGDGVGLDGANGVSHLGYDPILFTRLRGKV